MWINVKEFENVMQKATLNYFIDSLQINYNKQNITSKMISSGNEVVTILNLDNELFKEADKEISLNFSMPKMDVKPYLNLLDEDEYPCKINKNNIIINKEVKLYFDDEEIISTFKGDGPKDLDYFISFDINDEFKSKFEKIKKIGHKFGKIYFTVKENRLFIETMDKTNVYSNGVSFDLEKDFEYEDIVLCFDFSVFVNLMTILKDEFELKIAYVKEKEGGLIYVKNETLSEQYFLMSMSE